VAQRPSRRQHAAAQRTGWVLYPGSFDPVTYGHLDLIRRALKIFPGVVVAVANNSDKQPLFTVSERVAMLRKALRSLRHVEVHAFDMLMVSYAESLGIRTVVRGARMMSDFEYEFQLALSNRKLKPRIETVYLMPSERFAYFSSRLIKEAAALGADSKAFVPAHVARALQTKFRGARAR